MQLADNIYGYFWKGRGNNANSYLITTERNILIDPGHIVNEAGERCLEMLVYQLGLDSYSLDKIDLILCTHAHPDHYASAAAVQETSGALLAIHEKEKDLWEKLRQRRSNLPPIQPDFYLQEGVLQVMPSSLPIQVYLTPGHSPGSLCFHLPATKTLFTGDTIFQNSIGRTDLPGGSMQDIAKSVKKVMGIQDIELLLPGHMGPVVGGAAVQSNFQTIWDYFFTGFRP